ncbi:MAG: acyl-CoA dehydrogenase, partial [Myxococcales bacterium]|nr:acyl-CoA dehydrogenase [Myxococcales bacterium]
KLPDGRRVIDLPWVQSNLARVVAKIELLTLMHWRQAADIDAGFLNPADASAVKVFGSELYIEAYRALMEILGQGSTVIAGSPGALLQGKIERLYRSLLVLTFGGGTNEIQRSIIAMAGCMMPRSMV